MATAGNETAHHRGNLWRPGNGRQQISCHQCLLAFALAGQRNRRLGIRHNSSRGMIMIQPSHCGELTVDDLDVLRLATGHAYEWIPPALSKSHLPMEAIRLGPRPVVYLACCELWYYCSRADLASACCHGTEFMSLKVIE